ncbi:uncharacterized protein BJ171DRAFT_487642 [Polychytrium aggregatum]|uniref:uncharacterized protein n=1 Tax=Polychytrium aggregatum TaxID=110093 RepID=UPI0022FDC1E9|nr:uncharacterized protein BJ171DRAFT_487642 [Polychytrium aggregatum]KAI9208909.1 hypothetical protein BJ171DRAFT_487642 [Polychytrium aggregatum]
MESPVHQIYMITGANSGLGYALTKRLVAEVYIAKRQPMTVVMACRNEAKAKAAQSQLIQDLFDDEDEGRQVLQILLVDLSKPTSVIQACADFMKRFQRLDILYLNAAILNITGVNISNFFYNILTRPSYVAKTGGDAIDQPRGLVTEDGLGLCFAANTFGHYIMIKELEPVLKAAQPSKVIYLTSTSAVPDYLSLDDYQGIESANPYESSKRLGCVVMLQLAELLKSSGIYVCMASPGNIASSIIENPIIYACQIGALTMMRLAFASGCNFTCENGCTSLMYLRDIDPYTIDSKVIYHSDIWPWGNPFVKHLQFESPDMKLAEAAESLLHDLWSQYRVI